MIFLTIIVGLVALVWGADTLVRGASRLAFSLGVPPLIVGLTVVAFGTSAPELAVSVRAALAGEGGVGLGNVFGSNTINVLLVLGLSAAITRLPISSQLLRVDVPVLVLVSVTTWGLGWDGFYSRLDGWLLVSGLCLYLAVQFYLGKTHEDQLNEFIETNAFIERFPPRLRTGVAGVYCVVGLVALTVGADWLVTGSVELARKLGVGEEVIGLTIVSIGTSLPEIVTSIVAAARDERDMAVGNIVGSNLFNLLAVLGLASVVAPQPMVVSEALLSFDVPVMVGVAVACVPIFYIGRAIGRLEGSLMVVAYLGYLAFQAVRVVTVNE